MRGCLLSHAQRVAGPHRRKSADNLDHDVTTAAGDECATEHANEHELAPVEAECDAVTRKQTRQHTDHETTRDIDDKCSSRKPR